MKILWAKLWLHLFKVPKENLLSPDFSLIQMHFRNWNRILQDVALTLISGSEAWEKRWGGTKQKWDELMGGNHKKQTSYTSAKWLTFIWGRDFHCACQFSAHWAMSNGNNCSLPVVAGQNFSCKQNNYSERKLNKKWSARIWAWKFNKLQYAKTAILFNVFHVM